MEEEIKSSENFKVYLSNFAMARNCTPDFLEDDEIKEKMSCNGKNTCYLLHSISPDRPDSPEVGTHRDGSECGFPLILGDHQSGLSLINKGPTKRRKCSG